MILGWKQTQNRGLFWIKLETNGAWKNVIFGGYLETDVSFQLGLELLNFELCGQSYDQFTQDYAEYIGTGN